MEKANWLSELCVISSIISLSVRNAVDIFMRCAQGINDKKQMLVYVLSIHIIIRISLAVFQNHLRQVAT